MRLQRVGHDRACTHVPVLTPTRRVPDLEKTLATVWTSPSPNSTERPREVKWLIQGHTAAQGRKVKVPYLTLSSLSSNLLFPLTFETS